MRAPLLFKLQAFCKGKETVRTQLARKAGKKTMADINGLQRQVKELLEEHDKNQKTIADQLRTIQVANMTLEEVRRQNSDLHWEVRRAGRKLLELGA